MKKFDHSTLLIGLDNGEIRKLPLRGVSGSQSVFKEKHEKSVVLLASF
jgi:hypothetical protein